MGCFTLISDVGGGGEGGNMSSLILLLKTIEKVIFWEYFYMVKSSQISDFTGVSKGLAKEISVNVLALYCFAQKI